MTPQSRTAALERHLQQAGGAAAWPIERVFVVKMLGAVLLGAIGLLFVISRPGIGWVLLAIALVLLGWFGPDLIVVGRAQERMQRVGLELPEVVKGFPSSRWRA